MIPEELTALATSGANVLVAAMATSAWSAVRRGFVTLLSRGRTDDWAGNELDRRERLIEGGAGREIQVEVLASHIESLLSQHPEVAGELRDLIAESEKTVASSSVVVQSTGSITTSNSAGSINISGLAGNVTAHARNDAS
ncbi:hypothetical protein [Actinoplanes subglobosus]|uniref:Uncharacterized protein n=1 Tax=Actinoplanes subglobosus TaxID=1547892 RepID=A0ABV8J3T9_9ACTN